METRARLQISIRAFYMIAVFHFKHVNGFKIGIVDVHHFGVCINVGGILEAQF